MEKKEKNKFPSVADDPNFKLLVEELKEIKSRYPHVWNPKHKSTCTSHYACQCMSAHMMVLEARLKVVLKTLRTIAERGDADSRTLAMDALYLKDNVDLLIEAMYPNER